MNIRTITYFCDPGYPVSAERMTTAAHVVTEIKSALGEAGYTVQTTRLAAPPFPQVIQGRAQQAVAYARALEDACFIHGLDYATIGPVRPTDTPDFFHVIPDVIGGTQNVFAAAVIAEAVNGLNLPAIRMAAQIIRRCAVLTPDGLGNLRFAALANVPPGVPFLPAAYHNGGLPAVALGVEAAELAVMACAEATSLAEARTRLVEMVEAEAVRLTSLIKKVSAKRGLQFNGLDFSLAPYPHPARSLGTALERLTDARVGEHGVLAAAAFLAEALDRAQFKRTGFSGLFLPVLEDAVLARRAAQGLLTVNDLLLYSAVCGTGLDTVPLPGDSSPEALAAILLDVAALALRLNKPLTARLMPIPDKKAGDTVTFNFEFFAPSRVLNPRTSGLGGLFAEAGSLDLSSRTR